MVMAAAKEDIHTPLVFTIGTVFVILLFALILLLQAYFHRAQRQEYQTKVVIPRIEALDSSLAEQEQDLHSYRWIDRQSGVVGIPIARAVELVVAEGLSNAGSRR
jgi:hypothetical protein